MPLFRFLANRPQIVVASAVVLVVSGILILPKFPLEQYPEVAAPTVVVSARYPGASAQITADRVAKPIEEALGHVEGVGSLSSMCLSDGGYVLTVTFDGDRDLDTFAALIESRLARLQSDLPAAVVRGGIQVEPRWTELLLVVNLRLREATGADGKLVYSRPTTTEVFRTADAVRRVPGVSRVAVMGTRQRQLGIQLDPSKVERSGLTLLEVKEGICSFCGRGGLVDSREIMGVGNGSGHKIASEASSTDLEDAYRQLPLRSASASGIIRLASVAKVKWEEADDGYDVRYDGQPSVALAVWNTPHSNRAEVSGNVHAALADVSQGFGDRFQYEIAYDTARIVRAGTRLDLIVWGLALLAVVMAVQTLLGDWRVSLLAIVAIIMTQAGALLFLFLIGYSLNSFVTFGLTVSIVLPAVDTYLFVERVRQSRSKEEVSGKDAVIEAAGGLFGFLTAGAIFVVGIALLWPGVGGLRGQMIGPFAIALAAVAGSAWGASTLVVPALYGVMLRDATDIPSGRRSIRANRLEFVQSVQRIITIFLSLSTLGAMAIFVLLVGFAVYGLSRLPDRFLPVEDSGYLIVSARLPSTSSDPERVEVQASLERLLQANRYVDQVVTVSGLSHGEGCADASCVSGFARLQPWFRRWGTAARADSIAESLQGQLDVLQSAEFDVKIAASTSGVVPLDRLELVLRDVSEQESLRLHRIGDSFAALAAAQTSVECSRNEFPIDRACARYTPDLEAALERDVDLDEVDELIAMGAGIAYSHRWRSLGRTARIHIRINPLFFRDARDFIETPIRTGHGTAIPLREVVREMEMPDPQILFRENGASATRISSSVSPGFGISGAMESLEAVAAGSLPSHIEYCWGGMAAMERAGGHWTWFRIGFAIVAVYLFLLFYLEDWFLPLAIVSAVPMVLGGVAFAVFLRQEGANVVTEMACLLLVACYAKWMLWAAVLAQQERAEGLPISEAAMAAADKSYRRHLLGFLGLEFGAVPLILATGPGAAGLHSAGIALIFGGITATAQAMWLIPALLAVALTTTEAVVVLKSLSLRNLWNGLTTLDGIGARWRRGRRSSSKAISLPRDMVQTVTGPVPIEKLRTTLSHEHVFTDQSGKAGHDVTVEQVLRRMNDVFDRLRLKNVRTLIDCTPAYMGRNPQLMVECSRMSTIRIVTNTGYSAASGGRFLPPEVEWESAEELAQQWLNEWSDGIEGTGIRPGFIRIGVDHSPLTKVERKLVRAAALAHLESGLTIASSTPGSMAAEEQLSILEQEGVSPRAWIWHHAQEEPDVDKIVEAARSGAWVSFDGITSETIDQHVKLVRLLAECELLTKVLVSHNELGYRAGQKRGGPIRGYDAVFKLFLPALFRAGMILEQVEQIMVANPGRAFAVRVRKVYSQAGAEESVSYS